MVGFTGLCSQGRMGAPKVPGKGVERGTFDSVGAGPTWFKLSLMEVDRTGLQVLSRAECLALLRQSLVGRVIVTDRALPRRPSP